MVTALQGLFLENRNQSQRQHKQRQDKQPEQEVIHRSLEVEDHIRAKHELIMPGSIVVYSFSIRMIITKLGAYGNNLVGPPGDADGMRGIVRGEASPAADLVVKIFVAHG